MPQQTPQKRAPFARTLAATLLGLFVVFLLPLLLTSYHPPSAQAAGNANTVNFQARLLNAAGAVAPDGNYNVEFKLYTSPTPGSDTQGTCAGDANCVWVETRTGANVVKVVDGYLSVNLGSVTAFPSTINWNQPLYLTMNIGGIGSPSWDGEMNPRIQLTAVPYAFQATQLANSVGSYQELLQFNGAPSGNVTIKLPDASGTVCLDASVNNCSYLTGSSANGSYVQLQSGSPPGTAQTGNFNISGTGIAANLNATTGINTGSGTGTQRIDASGDLVNIGNITGSGVLTLSGTGVSSIMGSLGLGVTNPTGALTIANSAWINSINAAGTGYINILSVNTDNQIQLGAALNVDGGINLPTDAGQVTFSDLPLDSSATAGTPESYSFRVGSSNLLTLYGQSDGAGNAQDLGVAIGNSISPQGLLDVGGSAGDVVVSQTGTNLQFTGTSTNYIQATASSGYLDFVVNGNTASDSTSALRLAANNNVYIQNGSLNVGSTSQFQVDTSGNVTTSGTYNTNTFTSTALQFGASSAATVESAAGQNLSLQSGSTSGYLILQGSGGKVGIGTTTPADPLDVLGTAHFSGGATNGLSLFTTVGDYTGPAIISDASQSLLLNPNGNNVLVGANAKVYGTSLEVRQFSAGANPFSIDNAAGTASFLFVNSAGNVGIGTHTPAYPLDVVGDVNSSVSFSIAGTTVCTISGCTAASGSGNYIDNQTTQQASSNFNISGSGTIGTNLTVNGASTFTGTVTDNGNLQSAGSIGLSNGSAIYNSTAGLGAGTARVDEATTNYVTNPSFETGTTGWGTSGTGATISIVNSGPGIIAGKQALEANIATSNQSGVQYNITNLPAGSTYTISLYVTLLSGDPTALDLHLHSSAGTCGDNAAPSTLTVGQTERFTLTATCGTGTPSSLVLWRSRTATSNAVVVIDAAQAEIKPYATSYTDGSLGAGYAWTGTPNASTSTRAAGGFVADSLTAISNLSTGSNLSVAGNASVSGNITTAGTYNTNTFNSNSLQFGAAGSATISAASGQNLLLQSGSITGAVILQGSGGDVGIGTTTPTQKLEVSNGNIQVDNGNLNLTQQAAPGAPSVAVNATAGNLSGTYYYVVTYVTGQGQTNYGTVSAAVAPAAQQVDLSAIPIGPNGVTQRKIYRTTTNGTTSGPFYLVATIADNTTTTYTDNIADASLGATASDINYAGGAVQVSGVNVLVSSGSNVAVGGNALHSNTTGYQNTASGYAALYANTTGVNNTASGYATLYANTTGNDNTASGYATLYANTTGNDNTASGHATLYANTTGTYNTALGFQSGYTSVSANANTTGSNNTFIGYESGPGTTTQLQNATAIGNQAVVSASNSLVLGSIAGLNGASSSTNVGIGTASPAYALDVVGDTNTSGNLRTAGTTRITSAGALQNVTGDTSILTTGTLGIARGGTGLATTPTNGQLLIGNGTGYTQAGLTAGSGIAITTGSGSISVAVDGTVCRTTNNCTAVGAAGGDLTGSYPSPTIAKLQGNPLTITTPASGQVLQYNGTAFVNGLITNSNLQSGSFGNITGVGALASGSLASGFGTINIGNTITTTSTIQGATVTATGALQGNSLSINSGTLAVSSAGAITASTGITNSGTYNGNTFTSSTLQFNASSAATVESAAGQNLLLQSGSTSGNVILQGSGGTVTIGSTGTGGVFVNDGSTLDTALALGNFTANGAIGTAATTVDVYTTFTIPQTTTGITLTLPSPTNTAAGRIIYVANIGTAAFTISGDIISSGTNASFLWNGSVWTATAVSTGVTLVGALDGGTANSTGATISGNTIYLQSASATNPGLVNTTTQSFGGNKTFTGNTAIQTTSTTAFQVAGGSTLLNADTSNMVVSVGGAELSYVSGSGSLTGFAADSGSPFAVGSSPDSVTTATINGQTAIITANASSRNVSVLLGNGTGGFTPDSGSPFAVGNGPESVTTATINGQTAIITANYGDNTVSVLLGNGTGGFTPDSGSPFAVGNGPYSVTTATINGQTAIITANLDDNTVSVLLGNGTGGFTADSGSPFAVGSEPDSVTTATINGQTAIITANAGDNTVSVLLGNGTGGFTADSGSPFAVGSEPDSVTTATINGQTAIITANAGDNTVSVLLGNGTGGFTADSGSPFAVGSEPAVTTATINGQTAIITANYGDNTVSVLLGNGTGGFTPDSGSPFADSNGPASVTTATINGQTAIITANFNSNNVSVLLGTYGPPTTASGTLSLTPTSAAQAGLIIQGASGQTADLLHIQSSSGSALFNVSAAGNVGIGTASPSYNLDVQGTSGARIQTTTNSTTALQVQNAAGTTVLGVDTTDGYVNVTGEAFFQNNTTTTYTTTANNDPLQAQVASISDEGRSDPSDGYKFTPTVNGTITALGAYGDPNCGAGSYTVKLYGTSSTALASATVSLTNYQWTYTSITPVAVTAGTSYTVAYYSSPFGNSVCIGYVPSVPLSSGNITISYGVYGSSTGKPTTSYGVDLGYADVTFTTSSTYTGPGPSAIFNSPVGIDNSSPQYPLDVAGDINLTGNLRINGVIMCDFSGCAGGSGGVGANTSLSNLSATAINTSLNSSVGSNALYDQSNASGAGDSMLTLGADGTLSGGNANGTYIGINGSNSADFLNFQFENTTEFKVGSTGNVTASGTINATGYSAAGTAGISLSCGTNKVVHSVTVTDGIITAGSCSSGTLADLAEQYQSTQTLQAGDVVAVDPSNYPGVLMSSSAYQSDVIGVVSTNPAEVLDADDPGYPIALTGRVPVNVSLANGPIEPGDYLTSSSIPGYAMNATQPGTVIGVALTGLSDADATTCPSGTGLCGTVNVFMETSYYNPTTAGDLQNGSAGSFGSLVVSGALSTSSLSVSGDATFGGDVTVSGDVTANGTVTIQTDSTTAFQVESSAGLAVLTVDTTNNRVGIDTGSTEPGTALSVNGGNNINPSWPDGLVGTPITQSVSASNSYTVPQGKTLYIVDLYDSSSIAYDLNGITMGSSSQTLASPIPLAAGQALSVGAGAQGSVSFTGLLVNSGVTPITQSVSASTSYTVPQGKTLYIVDLYDSSSTAYNLNGVTMGSSSQTLASPIPLAAGQAFSISPTTQGPVSFTGYLTNANGYGGP